ncbi:hypothetical protein EIK77_000232 [Talaromyces pinophilus]|nr:hypothetical protein EIK77_000232 [Talaromyces pinophilus]
MTSRLQADDGLFEPHVRRTSSTQANSTTGIHSILNPIKAGNSHVDDQISQESNNKNVPAIVELPRPPSPQRHSASSPLLASISKSISAKPYLQGSSVSPSYPPCHIITPVSPTLRHASVGRNNHINTGSVGAAGNSGTSADKVTVSQLPFVQELSTGFCSTPRHGPGSSGPTAISIEYSSASRYSPKSAISIPGQNPLLATYLNPQTCNPSTPHSTFSSFATSPSITSGILPPLGQAASLSPSVDSRYGDDPNSKVAYPGPTDLLGQAGNQVQYGGGPMIPVTIDLKSGSRSQAEKRKANSDASRRFRNRKKNEAALEQKIDQLNEQLQILTEERDFYRNERDFFRDTLSEHIGVAQMPPRPASPAPSRRYTQSTTSPGDQPSPTNSHQQAISMEGEMSFKCASAGSSSRLAGHRQIQGS